MRLPPCTLLQLWKDIEKFQTRKLALRQIHNADFGNTTSQMRQNSEMKSDSTIFLVSKKKFQSISVI